MKKNKCFYVEWLCDWNNNISAKFEKHYTKGQIIKLSTKQLFELLKIYNYTLTSKDNWPRLEIKISIAQYQCTLNYLH
jgi:hypothetical protein